MRWTEQDLQALKAKSRVIVHKQDDHVTEPRTNTGTKLPFCTEEANACVRPDCAPGNGCIYDGLTGTDPEKGAAHAVESYGQVVKAGVASVKTRSRRHQERRQSISQPRRRVAKPTSEAKALGAIREYLQYHQKVAWVERMNTGALRVEGRFIRFGVPGLSDLIGMLKSGQFLAIEVKSSRGLLTPAQEMFLSRVRKWGGVSGVARTIEEVEKILSAS